MAVPSFIDCRRRRLWRLGSCLGPPRNERGRDLGVLLGDEIRDVVNEMIAVMMAAWEGNDDKIVDRDVERKR